MLKLSDVIDVERFQEYISPDCNRLAFLQNYLHEGGVDTAVIDLSGRKHLFVNFPSSSYNPQFKIKTFICHYDRVKDSPGANDNSAANFALADFAVNLFRSKTFHNVRMIFTDGEEFGEEGVKGQGAFALAELFRKLGIRNDDVYVFDACGRGDVAVLARAGIDSAPGGSFRKSLLNLYERTSLILKSASPEKWMSLPVPYSDNAGFLACGIPAVAITFLPVAEAGAYYKELMKDKNLEKAVMNCRIDENSDSKIDLSIQKFKFQEKMPVTWRMFHTECDNLLSLTPESFELLKVILEKIKEQKVLAI